jgi:hypothetical protein
MNARNPILVGLELALTTVTALVVPPIATAQPLSGSPADPQLKYSAPLPPGVYSPDKVETRLGTLNFFDGFPDKVTAEKLYDNLDFQRAASTGPQRTGMKAGRQADIEKAAP